MNTQATTTQTIRAIDPTTLDVATLNTLIARGRQERSAAAHALFAGIGESVSQFLHRSAPLAGAR
ncbi:MAG: hypothetical protein AAF321_06805 [Pseudomonadota bacterium]